MDSCNTTRFHRIVADGKSARNRLDPVAAAEAGHKGLRDRSILEIECHRVVDHTRRPGGGLRPAFGAASLVEPGVHNIELATQPFRRHRYPHVRRISPLCLAPGPQLRSDHAQTSRS